jgi:membrane associated rhomboid family serine protease
MGFVLLIWIVFWVEVQFNLSFNYLGIFPKTFVGLRGILFSPFIHGSVEHLYHNSLPLFILSLALFYFYRPIAWKVIIYGILLSGLITWGIGRPSYHIGASGLIYVLASFIFLKGIRTKYFRLVALSLIVVFIYGSMVWYVFPVKENISWEGHLAGLITGLLFAFLFNPKLEMVEKYDWERADYDEENDPFLKQFDKDGNFIPASELEAQESDRDEITYIYDYKEDKL